ncbi:BRO-N domain-containing protein [Megasphaera sp.]|jgi:prophage antirepressor-like protein|uniref:BRO-N domain-containing protein n=1 Tax=Megasphaera sp. TaxID=2023260 RepID=UPI002049CEEA|nr:MAG TPA: repressor domain protein [Caudoviricetes sp.]
MNDLQSFNNAEFGQVRTLVLSGTPWFVGKDIATALGYENAAKAIRDHVDNDDKKMGVQNVTPSITDSLGRKQYPTLINESGLYSLVLSSKLPTAKKFKHWVTSDVLPTIRKTGKYAVPKITPNPHYRTRMIKTAVKDIGDTADTIAQVFHVKKGIAMTASMQMVGEAYGIDTEPLRKLVPPEANPAFLTPTKIAAELKVLTNKGNPNPQRVNSLLKEIGFQESVGGHWHATEEGKKLSEAMPYTASSGHSGYQLLWSPKVIPMLRDLLEKGDD